MQLDDARGERRLEVGRVVLDADALVVVRGTEEVCLPPKEFRLLQFLLQSPGRTYTRMQLLDEMWGWDTEGAERTVDVHVNRLRTRFAGWGGSSPSRRSAAWGTGPWCRGSEPRGPPRFSSVQAATLRSPTA